MKYDQILQNLVAQNILSPQQAERILADEKDRPFSIHWELRTILYLGITFLSGGLGTLIYLNIDSIGHGAIVAFISLLCLVAFGYAFLKRVPFTLDEAINPSKFADFALLLGCLLFLTLEGYLQYQYNFFGTQYGLATMLPAILFIFCAYFFDHRGVLTMGLTALASWVGLSIVPQQVFENDFSNQGLLASAIILGLFLVAVGVLSERFSFKKHFAFTYFLLGGNLATVAALAGLFSHDEKIIYFILIMLLAYLSVIYARQKQSYLFLLLGVIYGYIALTYSIFYFLPQELSFSLATLYFFGSGIGMVIFLIKIKDILGKK